MRCVPNELWGVCMGGGTAPKMVAGCHATGPVRVGCEHAHRVLRDAKRRAQVWSLERSCAAKRPHDERHAIHARTGGSTGREARKHVAVRGARIARRVHKYTHAAQASDARAERMTELASQRGQTATARETTLTWCEMRCGDMMGAGRWHEMHRTHRTSRAYRTHRTHRDAQGRT